MKLVKMMVVLAVMGTYLALGAASLVAANGQGSTPAPAPASAQQLIDEAKKLSAAHDYQGALKRLQAVKTGDLNFFEKTFTFDPLLAKTEKAVPAKAADEKALADGNEALGKERFATAVDKFSQAADSDYLAAEQATQAKALLLKAKDGLKAANDKAVALIGQAKTALKAGKVADARKDVDQVAAMDVKLGWQDRAALERQGRCGRRREGRQGRRRQAGREAPGSRCGQAGREGAGRRCDQAGREGPRQAVGHGPGRRGPQTL